MDGIYAQPMILPVPNCKSQLCDLFEVADEM